RRQPTHPSASVALTQLLAAQTSIALGARGATACNFPAGSFIEGFRRPATVQAASLRSAGIRNPQQERKSPHYSITSLAIASRVAGTTRPSAFAVLRLTTNSNWVGCWTGRSAGFAPLRILSTKTVASFAR